jgi:hypothetical protein
VLAHATGCQAVGIGMTACRGARLKRHTTAGQTDVDAIELDTQRSSRKTKDTASLGRKSVTTYNM